MKSEESKFEIFRFDGDDQKSSSSKAAVLLAASRRAQHLLTRGAYSYYVSTAKWRERRLAYPILKGGPFVFNIPLKHPNYAPRVHVVE